jgi:hypothetical protein
MPPLNLRAAARAIVLDEDDSILILRMCSISRSSDYQGPDLFSRRDLVALMTSLIDHGVPAEPLLLGL